MYINKKENNKEVIIISRNSIKEGVIYLWMKEIIKENIYYRRTYKKSTKEYNDKDI